MDSEDKVQLVAIIGFFVFIAGTIAAAFAFDSMDKKTKAAGVAECVKATGKPLDCKAAFEK